MEDDKLRELFKEFDPVLSSDDLFISRLQQNMEAVEIIKHRALISRRINKIAVIIAAIAGFVIGAIFKLLFPIIVDCVSTISLTVPFFRINPININISVILWIITAMVSGIIAYNAYEITISKLTTKNL